MLKRTLIPLLVLVALLLASAPAWAQANANPQPIYTYVSEWSVPRAQWDDMQKTFADDKAVEDPLVGNGALLGYGSYENLVHSEGGVTHGTWMQGSSIASILKTLQTIYAKPGMTTAPVLAASKHQDYFLVSTIYGGGPVTNAAGYIRVVGLEVKPGRMDDFQEAYRRYIVPVDKQLLADGSIVAYELDSEYVVANAPGRAFLVWTMRDEEGPDKVRAAIGEAFRNNPAVVAALDSDTVPNSRNDLLARVLAMTHK